MSTTYEKAMAALAEVEAVEKTILDVFAPGPVEPMVSEALNVLKTILATTFGGVPLSPDGIDEAARLALDARFPGK
jgi:hypothetical protein